MKPNPLPFALLIAATAAASYSSACSDCTEVGCFGNVVVNIVDGNGAVFSEVSGRVETPETNITFACGVLGDGSVSTTQSSSDTVAIAGGCGSFPLVLEFFGPNDQLPSAILLVASAGEPVVTATRTAQLNYRSSFPNGEGCGPECRSAEVTFVVQ